MATVFNVNVDGGNSVNQNLDMFKSFLNIALNSLNSAAIPQALAETAAELAEPYTPYLEGNLLKDVTVNNGEITYPGIPYANRLFYGYYFNFTRDFHPDATFMWLLAADTAQFVSEAEKKLAAILPDTFDIGKGTSASFGTGFSSTGGGADILANHVSLSLN